MQVELDVYSGRPNPRWELDTAQSAELARRLAALPPAAVAAGLPDALGYRGLRLEPRGGQAAGDRVEVGAGMVRVTRPDGVMRQRSDPGRALERWLIETGRGRIDPALRDMAAAEAARDP